MTPIKNSKLIILSIFMKDIKEDIKECISSVFEHVFTRNLIFYTLFIQKTHRRFYNNVPNFWDYVVKIKLKIKYTYPCVLVESCLSYVLPSKETNLFIIIIMWSKY